MSFTLYEKFTLKETFVLLEADSPEIANLQKLINDIKTLLSTEYTAENINKAADTYDADIQLANNMEALGNKTLETIEAEAGWDAIKKEINKYLKEFTKLFNKKELALIDSPRVKKAYDDFREVYSKPLNTEAEITDGKTKFKILTELVSEVLKNPDNQMLDLRATIVPAVEKLNELIQSNAIIDYANSADGATHLSQILNDTEQLKDVLSTKLTDFEDSADFMTGLKSISDHLQTYIDKYTKAETAEGEASEGEDAEEAKEASWNDRYNQASGAEAKSQVLTEFIEAMCQEGQPWHGDERAVRNFGTAQIKHAIRTYGFDLKANPGILFFEELRKNPTLIANLDPLKIKAVFNAVEKDGYLTIQDIAGRGAKPTKADNIIFNASFYQFEVPDIELLLKIQAKVIERDGQVPSALDMIPERIRDSVAPGGKIKLNITLPALFCTNGSGTQLKSMHDIKTISTLLVGNIRSNRAFNVDTDIAGLLKEFKVVKNSGKDVSFSDIDSKALAAMLCVLRSFVNEPDSFNSAIASDVKLSKPFQAAYKNMKCEKLDELKKDHAKYLNQLTITEEAVTDIVKKLSELLKSDSDGAA